MPVYEIVYSNTGVNTGNKPFHPTLSHLCRTLLLTNYNCYPPLPFVLHPSPTSSPITALPLHLPSLPSHFISHHCPPTSSPITALPLHLPSLPSHFISHHCPPTSSPITALPLHLPSLPSHFISHHSPPPPTSTPITPLPLYPTSGGCPHDA